MNPEEADKRTLLFKIGIVIIIVAVFSLWLANLQNVFESKSNTDNDTLKNITDDINKSLKEVEDNINRAASSTESNFVDNLLDKASSTATSTAVSTSTAAVELKKELTDLMKDTTTTSTTTKNSCPPYINCMPTIGEARPCTIPVGCEEITQIAY